MESANLHHHHQLQEHQLVLSSSSSLSSSHNSSTHEAGTSPHACTQSITLNTASNNFHLNCNGVVLNPRQKNESLVPTLNTTTTSMIQDLGFHHWNLTNNAGSFTDHDLQLSKIKQELSDSFPARFTNISHNSTTPSSIDDHQKNLNDLREKLLLKTISSGFPINGEMHSSPHHGYVNSLGSLSTCMPSRGHFSQIYPSINISNLNQSSPPSSSSSISSSNSFNHMNLQALDLLTSSSSFSPHHDHNLGLFRDTALFNLDRLNPTTLKPSSCSPSKVTSYTNQITEPKRPNGLVEPKPAQTPAPKKPRVESRVTSPPFKVRKEKLGDRIAALQQLVAPFGKTDTASVLMEAIGYIKFLQSQVETLSVPYMKSSRNNSSTRTMQGVYVADDGTEEPKRDLRSRGLCLVPLSCMSYVTADSTGGGIWPPPNFGGGT